MASSSPPSTLPSAEESSTTSNAALLPNLSRLLASASPVVALRSPDRSFELSDVWYEEAETERRRESRWRLEIGKGQRRKHGRVSRENSSLRRERGRRRSPFTTRNPLTQTNKQKDRLRPLVRVRPRGPSVSRRRRRGKGKGGRESSAALFPVLCFQLARRFCFACSLPSWASDSSLSLSLTHFVSLFEPNRPRPGLHDVRAFALGDPDLHSGRG